MIKITNIPTNEQLINISKFLIDELKDIKKDNMYVVFELEPDLLRQIDEEYFFKNNKDANSDDFTPSDEVELNISNIKFKFIKTDAQPKQR